MCCEEATQQCMALPMVSGWNGQDSSSQHLMKALLVGNRYFGCSCSTEMVSFFRVIVFAHVFAAWLKFFKIPQALACCGSTAFGNGLAEYCANFSLVS